MVGRPVRPDRVPPSRQGDEAARVLRLEPDLRASPAVRSRRPARPRSSRGAAGTRTRRSGAPALRSRPPCGSRSCTTPPARTATRAAQSPAIVRAIQLYHVQGKRLERHRLQLPRRPLRPGLRGPLRRDRAERGRRPRRGVQHRLGRRRAARRVQLARGRAEGARRSRGPARVAARHRARRPRDDALLHLGRQRSFPGRVCPSSSARSPATATPASPTAPGTSLYGLLNQLAGDVSRRRPAEAVLAGRHRHRAGHGSLQGAAVVGAAVDGRGLRLGRATSSAPRPASGRTWTGRGTRRCSRPAATRMRSARRRA